MTATPPLAPERLDRPFGDALVSRLFPPLSSGVHWGLERTQAALSELGDPHRAYRTLHIGGTNGKGSVTSTLASVMTVSGHRAASYTSPHLCSFRERMLIDGRPLPEEDLVAYAGDVRDAISRYELTFFEATTVLAFYAFARRGVDVAVLEVGLGGRLDATNVVVPEVSAVTNIAIDHAEYLGGTLPEIAREKAGIIKPGVPFVTAEADPDVRAVLEDRAREVGAPFFSFDPTSVVDLEVEADHTSFSTVTRTYGDLRIRTPLVGRHQAANAGLAVSVLEALRPELRPDGRQVLEGIRRVEYHGRDEVIEVDGRTWLFDVAHNAAGMASLVDTLGRLALPGPVVALVGIQGDKDWPAMLSALFSRLDRAILTQPPSVPVDRRWDPRSAAASVESATPVEVIEDFDRALDRARESAGVGGTVVVTGSVHTVGGTMKVMQLEPLGH